MFIPLQNNPPLHRSSKGRGGNNIVVGTVVKSKLGELEEDIKEEFCRCLRKDLIGALVIVVSKNS